MLRRLLGTAMVLALMAGAAWGGSTYEVTGAAAGSPEVLLTTTSDAVTSISVAAGVTETVGATGSSAVYGNLDRITLGNDATLTVGVSSTDSNDPSPVNIHLSVDSFTFGNTGSTLNISADNDKTTTVTHTGTSNIAAGTLEMKNRWPDGPPPPPLIVGSVNLDNTGNLTFGKGVVFSIDGDIGNTQSRSTNTGVMTFDLGKDMGDTHINNFFAILTNKVAADVSGTIPGTGIINLVGTLTGDTGAITFANTGSNGRINLATVDAEHKYNSFNAAGNSLLISTDKIFTGNVFATETLVDGEAYAIKIESALRVDFRGNVIADNATDMILIENSAVASFAGQIAGAVKTNGGDFRTFGTAGVSFATGSTLDLTHGTLIFGNGGSNTLTAIDATNLTTLSLKTGGTSIQLDPTIANGTHVLGLVTNLAVSQVTLDGVTATNETLGAFLDQFDKWNFAGHSDYSYTASIPFTGISVDFTADPVANVAQARARSGQMGYNTALTGDDFLQNAINHFYFPQSYDFDDTPSGVVNEGFYEAYTGGQNWFRVPVGPGGADVRFAVGEGWVDAKNGGSILHPVRIAQQVAELGAENTWKVNLRNVEGYNALLNKVGGDYALATHIMNACYLNRFWVRGLGMWQDADAYQGRAGYKYDGWGAQLGYDRAFGPMLLGGSFAYVQGDYEDKIASAHDSDIKNYNFNLYATYNHRSGFFGTLMGGYTYSDDNINELRDVAPAPAATWMREDYHTNTWYAGAKLGYVWRPSRNFYLIPSAGLAYINSRAGAHTIYANGFATESISKGKADSFILPVQLAANYDVCLSGDSKLTLSVNGGYSYYFDDDGPSSWITDLGQAQPPVAMGSVNHKTGKNQWNVGAGLKYTYRSFDVGVNYDYYNRSKYDAHRVMGTVGVSF